MRYTYLVSYSYTSGAKYGFGYIEIKSNYKIDSSQSLEDVIELIRKEGDGTKDGIVPICLNLVRRSLF